MRGIGKQDPERQYTVWGAFCIKKCADVSLAIPCNKIGSTVSARLNGPICDDFAYDKNIYGEIFRESGNLKIRKSGFYFLAY